MNDKLHKHNFNKTVCLMGLQGSRMLGLNQKNDADWDYRGVFIEDHIKLLSLDKPKETIEFGSYGDNEEEFVFHEVEKFFRLALKGNPSVLHLFFLPKYEIKTDVGQEILANKDIFLGETPIRKAFAGYAKSQIEYLKRNGKFNRGKKTDAKVKKHIRHCFRLFDTGKELLETGNMTLPLQNPQYYIDIAENGDIDTWYKLFNKKDKEFKRVKSCLSQYPNKEAANYLLLKIRRVAR